MTTSAPDRALGLKARRTTPFLWATVGVGTGDRGGYAATAGMPLRLDQGGEVELETRSALDQTERAVAQLAAVRLASPYG